ncbi:MAG: HAD-IA family hydrolase [Gammaproteobacteria bacterium]|nr:HAD-IA family hydrolase [Gammaproteobacteria bacterium]NIM71811.1 HAD-IA family hydrolase [Gammaproteobacteria bacterium]NIN37933.1 HAD-IA family hydrolase [Gammaproteobacteria bacterium]NIO23567.1 HAD-IA family hydrolase [Gammaproteobacteria bacterium]NIO64183.1 HAD-IA family hydrolase [Gammaproteobacteria bacterium]
MSGRPEVSRYRLLVFDWDGTLADSEQRIVAAAHTTIEALGLPPRSTEAIREIIGLAMSEAWQALFPEVPRSEEARFIACYREHYLSNAGTPVPLFPGAKAALQGLAAQRYRLAVATGKGRRGLDRDMAVHGLERLFSTTRSADEAPSKPHPQMLVDIIEELDVDAGETLMIGDTAFDLEMARNAGVASIAVASGVHTPERLLDFDPLALLETIAELPGWLADQVRN